jgi:hypothetical protein
MEEKTHASAAARAVHLGTTGATRATEIYF